MPISKAVEVIEGKSWVIIYEYPKESLVLEDLQVDPRDSDKAFSQTISFSKEAVSKLIPLMTEWLEEKQ